jgi:hypothetical protein
MSPETRRALFAVCLAVSLGGLSICVILSRNGHDEQPVRAIDDLHRLGRDYSMFRDYSEESLLAFCRDAERLSKEHPDDPRPTWWRAFCLEEQGKAEEALLGRLRALVVAREHTTTDTDLRYYYHTVFEKYKNSVLEVSVVAFLEFLELDPNFALAYYDGGEDGAPHRKAPIDINRVRRNLDYKRFVEEREYPFPVTGGFFESHRVKRPHEAFLRELDSIRSGADYLTVLRKVGFPNVYCISPGSGANDFCWDYELDAEHRYSVRFHNRRFVGYRSDGRKRGITDIRGGAGADWKRGIDVVSAVGWLLVSAEAILLTLDPICARSGALGRGRKRDITDTAAHNAVGLAGEGPVVGIDCLPT